LVVEAGNESATAFAAEEHVGSPEALCRCERLVDFGERHDALGARGERRADCRRGAEQIHHDHGSVGESRRRRVVG
jgi:hypothetical protein